MELIVMENNVKSSMSLVSSPIAPEISESVELKLRTKKWNYQYLSVWYEMYFIINNDADTGNGPCQYVIWFAFDMLDIWKKII